MGNGRHELLGVLGWVWGMEGHYTIFLGITETCYAQHTPHQLDKLGLGPQTSITFLKIPASLRKGKKISRTVSKTGADRNCSNP
eukprot:949919-Pelagomonas_calceolata.AAC.1